MNVLKNLMLSFESFAYHLKVTSYVRDNFFKTMLKKE